MKFVFIHAVFLFLSARLSDAQDRPAKGCSFYRPVLFCRGQLPNAEDLQNSAIKSLILFQLPEGTWLSLEKPQSSISEIQKIEIQYSFIAKVDTGYFAKVAKDNNLKRLTLRDVQGSVVVDKNMLQGLEQSLKYLTVNNGLAVNIADLAEFAHLSSLELMGTTIIGSPKDFENLLPQLRLLSVQKCNFTQLPWQALAKWMAENRLRRLKILDNNWICDCSMMKLKRLKSGFIENDLQRLTCSGPPNVAGKQLSELTENDLCSTIEPNLDKSDEQESLKALGSTSNDGERGGVDGFDGDSVIAPSRGQPVEASPKEKSSSTRTDIIIAGSVVGVLALAFIVFIIVYRCRLYPTGKNAEEKTSRTHQNKRYVNVIEEPRTRQYGDNGQAKANGKFVEGVPV